ncbi:MAG: hypothetical protein HC800_06345 [Phormidesmis sp. RL_2_1]|nr:hypothetical protein [Phormidesmis sp. RL_2_1]
MTNTSSAAPPLNNSPTSSAVGTSNNFLQPETMRIWVRENSVGNRNTATLPSIAGSERDALYCIANKRLSSKAWLTPPAA